MTTLVRQAAAGSEIAVRVITRGSRNEIVGVFDQALRVRLTAPPVGGAANDALITLLAQRLDVPRRTLRIVTGLRSRHKRVAVDGLSTHVVEKLLGLGPSGHRI